MSVVARLKERTLRLAANARGWRSSERVLVIESDDWGAVPIGALLVPTYVFYSRPSALAWVDHASFPKDFKLRRGAGASGVSLVRDASEARRLVNKAFGRGFPLYDRLNGLEERWRRYREEMADITEVAKGVARLILPPPYSRLRGRERGYIYFQDFIPNNDSDIRIVVIGQRAFALKRMSATETSARREVAFWCTRSHVSTRPSCV